MEGIIAGTGLIDLVIAATLIEWVALLLLWRRKRRGLPEVALSLTLLPGLCLMLALRSAMLGLPWYAVMLLLLAAGLTHLIDLRRRWIR
jgi:hypothetical protein